jgi:hypothetical protein
VEKLEQSVLLGYLGPSGEMVTTSNRVQPHFEGLTRGPAWLLLQGLQKVKCPKARPNKEKNCILENSKTIITDLSGHNLRSFREQASKCRCKV